MKSLLAKINLPNILTGMIMIAGIAVLAMILLSGAGDHGHTH